ncbi:cdkn1a interacting zinc finger protein 1b [Thalassophryne amazonica]|uniref:cdkn1a interacting zinc finger protein 1b n=1 Tax=Thalassophryne amazonica TaxID=390379 RepID=UPI0014716539|nr:cdkn1a interacting zinc finger protein 1b [Thalassophryne amazonica]
MSLVQCSVGLGKRKHPLNQQLPARTCVIPGSTTTEKEGDRDVHWQSGSAGEAESKRPRLERTDKATRLTNREKAPESCDSAGSAADQQGSAECSEASRAAELQSVGSLKVTIQQSSESREFRQTDRSAERQTGGFHCHVCDCTCRTLQGFQQHMSEPGHQKKVKEITHTICRNAHTLQDRGRRSDVQRWCDTCQIHFTGDIILHRRTKQHKLCKQLSRPFCPVCKRHFRTPRKFVEHMKSLEHKQKVQLEEAQEEELITVDAVGCFEGEEGEQEEAIELGDKEVEGKDKTEEEVTDTDETQMDEYDPNRMYGSSFVVPVSGFLCQLCHKFFHKETTARHTHCRTHTHFINLQVFRATDDVTRR